MHELLRTTVLDIDEVKSVPYVPASHPFIERLIGTVRREYLDRLFFWNSVELTRKLEAFRNYYNEFAFTARVTEPRQRTALARHLLPRRCFMPMYGSSIVRDYSKPRWPLDYELATHRR